MSASRGVAGPVYGARDPASSTSARTALPRTAHRKAGALLNAQAVLALTQQGLSWSEAEAQLLPRLATKRPRMPQGYSYWGKR